MLTSHLPSLLIVAEVKYEHNTASREARGMITCEGILFHKSSEQEKCWKRRKILMEKLKTSLFFSSAELKFRANDQRQKFQE